MKYGQREVRERKYERKEELPEVGVGCPLIDQQAGSKDNSMIDSLMVDDFV